MMSGSVFGSSGRTVVIEEYMTGPEVTVYALLTARPFSPCLPPRTTSAPMTTIWGRTRRDGFDSPSPFYTPEIERRCHEEIFIPTIRAMEREGCPFKGVLYFGLMLTADGPKVVEYNARFGDPETQAILVRLESDLFEIMRAAADGTLMTSK